MNNPMFAATSEHETNEFMPPIAYKRARTYEPESRGLYFPLHYAWFLGDIMLRLLLKSVNRYLNDFDFSKKSIPLSVPLNDDMMEFQLGNW